MTMTIKELLTLIESGVGVDNHLGYPKDTPIHFEDALDAVFLHRLLEAEILEGGDGRLTASIPDEMVNELFQPNEN